jgi:alkylation response protein AidB-like acyl-CoA dehydrogenase
VPARRAFADFGLTDDQREILEQAGRFARTEMDPLQRRRNTILANAGEPLRRRCVPAIRDGRAAGALGLTEPHAGSDALGGMRTTARRDGDDRVLNAAARKEPVR